VKPVPQKVLVSPGVRGDCFRACMASILELDSEDVPHFVAIEKDWWGEVQRWLEKRSLIALWFRLDPDVCTICWPLTSTVYCILSGPSPRGGGLQHSVVGEIGDGWSFMPVYDPHPSGEMLAGPATSALFLLPLNPNKVTA
jgi:hypothetical protein